MNFRTPEYIFSVEHPKLGLTSKVLYLGHFVNFLIWLFDFKMELEKACTLCKVSKYKRQPKKMYFGTLSGHTVQDSFSAVSNPILATTYSLESPAEIYTMHSFAQLSNRKKFLKNCSSTLIFRKKPCIELLQIFAKSCRILLNVNQTLGGILPV